jgi:hypothetical protein
VVVGRRTFTTSRSLAKTLAIHNPQTDEDGKDMVLDITPRAANVRVYIIAYALLDPD